MKATRICCASHKTLANKTASYAEATKAFGFQLKEVSDHKNDEAIQFNLNKSI
jgi:hypothetical protein